MSKFKFVSLLTTLLIPSFVFAYPIHQDIPDSLKPWVPWILHQKPDLLCPMENQSSDQRECDWGSSELSLNIDSDGASFTQKGQVFTKSYIRIPGSTKFWPQEVSINGNSSPVIAHDDQYPYLLVSEGQFTIQGRIQWKQSPDSLNIPENTGIVALTLNGKVESFPRIDKNGQLWLGQSSDSDTHSEENALDLRVFRKISDSNPLILNTYLKIFVSGKAREQVLPQVLLGKFIPMQVSSSLSNQFEEDGSLRVQLKPGTWTIEIKSRYPGPLDEIKLDANLSQIAEEEVWVFEADPLYRISEVTGPLSIDPQQTSLPDEWKKYPAYRMTKQDQFKIKTIRRGDQKLTPDELKLHRKIWLDFDGKGFSIQDKIDGTLKQSNRLDVLKPLNLGQVKMNGEPSLITQNKGKNLAGVEVRQGNLNLLADSRIDEKTRSFTAVSWNHDFQKVDAELILPPGWKLLAATGVETASGTWVGKWTLLDFFLVLLSIMIFFKLWGWRWGLISLATLAITFIEKGAPQYIWLFLLLGQVFIKVVQKDWAIKIARTYSYLCIAILLMILLPFSVNQIRKAIYPILEKSNYGMPSPVTGINYRGSVNQSVNTTGDTSIDEPYTTEEDISPEVSDGEGYMPNEKNREAPKKMKQPSYRSKSSLSKPYGGAYSGKEQSKDRMQLNQARYLPGAKVQTGPGLPTWSWNTHYLKWNGEVLKEQELRLFLLSPCVVFFLNLFQVLFMVLLLGRFLNLKNISLKWPPQIRKLFVPMLVLCIVGFSGAARAEFPSENLLQELENRLGEKPECSPKCASIDKMKLQVQNNSLLIQLDVSSFADTAIALPGNISEWNPTTVQMDGLSQNAMRRNSEGNLYLQVKMGKHKVTLTGPLSNKNVVPIALPARPYYVEHNVQGWTLDGLDENGRPSASLQLSRSNLTPQNNENFQNTNLPPFLEVSRTLYLGLEWRMETTVYRKTPTGQPAIVEIPLLPGEKITTSQIQVKEGKIQVNMNPRASSLTWESVLKQNNDLKLEAFDTPDYKEIWRVDASPLWHVDYQGLAPIHSGSSNTLRVPEFHPWSGESLQLKIYKPEAIQGQTLTIQSSNLEITPGVRSTQLRLNFNLKSSLGTQHQISVPQSSILKSVKVNGLEQALSLEKDKLTLPVIPGSQNYEIELSYPKGISTFFKTPQFDLGLPHVNANLKISFNGDRWILFTGGPNMGPAILFWGYIAMLIIFSYLFSRSSTLSPLKFHQWFLLGIGLSQIPLLAAAIVFSWFVLMQLRARSNHIAAWQFNLRQLFILGWTPIVVIILIVSVREGLLGNPDMQILGNGSDAYNLYWFMDRMQGLSPKAWLISLPLFAYRIAMLVWALWLAWSFVSWTKWGYASFKSGGFWKNSPVVKQANPIATEENKK